MTASFDPAPELDDRPAHTGAALVPYRARPSRLGRIFRWWLGLSVVVLVLCGLFLSAGLHNLDFTPVHIVIDGDDGRNGITINGLGDNAQALLGMGALMLGLLVLLLVPVLLLLVVGVVAVSLVIGIGVPLIALALALAVATSPFWLVGLLVWLVVRRSGSRAGASSARMAA